MSADREALRVASLPPLDRQLDALLDAGAALAAACAQLVREPTTHNADCLLARLAGAQEGVRHVRRRLQAEEAQ